MRTCMVFSMILSMMLAATVAIALPFETAPIPHSAVTTSPLPVPSGWNIETIGTWNDGGPSYRVAVRNDTVYFGNGTYLEIVDWTDPYNPNELGRLLLPRLVTALAVEGTHVYLSAGEFYIIDISDPANPAAVGSYEAGAVDIVIKGTYAFLASDGLRILDISNPANPSQVGYFAANYARGVAIDGNFACLAADTTMLRIIDISTPTTPTQTGVYITGPGKWIMGVDASGGYAYISELIMPGLLRVIDISNPYSPTARGYYQAASPIEDISVNGTYAYIALGRGFKMIDISDPDNPGEAASYQHAQWGAAHSVAVEDDYAYVALTGDGVRAIYCSTPFPVPRGHFDTMDTFTGIAIEGDYAFMANNMDGVRIVDIADSTSPGAIGSFQINGWVNGIATNGGYAYLASGSSTLGAGGLRILDISTPATPTETGHYDPGINATDVVIGGTYAYIVSNYDGLRIVDISTPTAPTLTGQWGPFSETIYSGKVFVQDNRSYVINRGTSLWIVDTSTPTNPAWMGRVPGDSFEDVVVSGNYAYVAAGENGLSVVDVSDPIMPYQTSILPADGSYTGIAISGDYLYCTGTSPSLTIYYIGEAGNPLRVGSSDDPYTPKDVAIDGHMIYTANYSSGLIALTFTPPPTAVLITGFTAVVRGDAVTLIWNIQTDESPRGFNLYRSSERAPYEKLLTGGALPPGTRSYIDSGLDGGDTYSYRLGVVKADNSEVFSQSVTVKFKPISLSLAQNMPNPFTRGTAIHFSLPEESRVIVTVYDIEGRVVRVLVDDVLPAGAGETVWNGTDSAGRAVSPGIYFYRLRAGKRVLSRKAVFTR